MKFKTAIPSIAAALLAAAPFASAQNATTDPVGFVTTTVNSNADQPIGTPLQQAPIFLGSVTSSAGNSIGLSGSVTVPANCYLIAVSGNASGKWEAISSQSSNTSVTLAGSISGLAVGDSIAIRPFWTLSTLFPSGGGIPASSDLTLPVAFVLLNNPSANGINIPAAAFYAYHTGEQLPAGWYDVNTFELSNDVIVSPEVYLTIRNQTGSSISVPQVGNVPTARFGIDIVSKSGNPQDNLVYNQFPTAVNLADSQLAQSGAVAPSSDLTLPGDLVLVFNDQNSGLNPAAAAFYAYHSGEQLPAGWYDINTFESADGVQIPAGAAFTIRKAAGSNSQVTWNPAVPYNLN